MVNGKQIKDTSINLIKVNPATGQLLTLVGTTKIQQNAAPTVGIDLVNKDYVDGLVTGLDFKQSVRVASNGTSINIAIAPATIDGVTLAPGERVLLKDQAPATRSASSTSASVILLSARVTLSRMESCRRTSSWGA